jgi:hypothetical protein
MCTNTVVLGNLRESDYLEDLDADIGIIIDGIFKKSVRGLYFFLSAVIFWFHARISAFLIFM